MKVNLNQYDAILRRKRGRFEHRVQSTLLIAVIVVLLFLNYAAPILGPAVKIAMCDF